MIVLDTHAWLWAYGNDGRLSAAAHEAIADADIVGIAAISLWEAAMLERRGRIVVNRPARDWLDAAIRHPRLRVIPVTPELAVESAALALPHGDPADRMIVATARVHGVRLVTKDGKIANAGVVETLW